MRRLALTLAAFSLLAVACSDDAPSTGTSPTDAPSSAPPSTAPPSAEPSAPEPPPEDAAFCSTAGIRLALIPQEGLPEAVAQTRQRIFDAAIACDFGTLTGLTGPEFTYSFGVPEQDAGEYWRQVEIRGQRPQPLLTLVTLLNLPYAESPDDDAPDTYVWPAVFATSADADWAAVEQALGADVAATFRGPNGEYLGYRVGISGDGAWLFYVAGD